MFEKAVYGIFIVSVLTWMTLALATEGLTFDVIAQAGSFLLLGVVMSLLLERSCESATP
ncbi:hypothetical protein HGQ17_11605 [Nesterenkonia sp. MY13]|uniref:Uncharacterized protein n=1 Tax=Nesterenkonia sedimenti TaxID=1463632 RepID=A0A7X8TL67_9MICC|nr:hypothetical protein [Nesterenkonia sedimenti]NLS10624.1 hypothetical protein [Nesterenkonia sedimenti]